MEFNFETEIGLVMIQTSNSETLLRELETFQHHFRAKCLDHERQKQLSGSLVDQENAAKNTQNSMNYLLHIQNKELIERKDKLIGFFKGIVNGLTILVTRLIEEELKRFSWEQQQTELGGSITTGIEKLQCWSVQLVELIWASRAQVDYTIHLMPSFIPKDHIDLVPLQDLQLKQNELYMKLVKSTFIVEHQPPQIIATQKPTPKNGTRDIKDGLKTRAKKFQKPHIVVRYLLGAKLNLDQNPPLVKVRLINEEQAEALGRNVEGALAKNSGTIVNDSARMETHSFSAFFRSLQLASVVRKRNGADLVMEEKYCFYFEIQMLIQNEKIKIYALSNPVLIIVKNSAQGAQAEATAFWDTITSTYNRIPFYTPERCDWNRVAAGLREKFRLEIFPEDQNQMPKGLSEDHLAFLREKAIGESCDISWELFAKESLFYDYSGKHLTFSFWNWFFEAVKLIKKHLRNLWHDDLIMGFVSRKMTEQLLKTRPDWTFLIRFSDSTPGAITIGFVNNKRQVEYLIPLNSGKLAIKELADRIKKHTECRYLYHPTKVEGIPRDVAFFKHYSKEDTAVIPGYIHRSSSIAPTPLIENATESSSNGDIAHQLSPNKTFQPINYGTNSQNSLFNNICLDQINIFDTEMFGNESLMDTDYVYAGEEEIVFDPTAKIFKEMSGTN